MKTKPQNCSQGETMAERRGWLGRIVMLAVCVGVAVIGLAATWARARAAERSEDGLWEQAEQVAQRLRERGEILARARVFRLEEARLARVLAGGANSNEKDRGDKRGVMTLPMPEGAFERVRLEEVQVMEPALAARFPEIKNYRGESVEGGAWSLRMTHSPQGLSAFITDGVRTVSIQPVEVDGTRYYVSAWGQDYEAVAGEARCLVGETELRGQDTRESARRTARRNLRAFAPPVGATKRTYRIAIATTAQYVTDFGGSSSAQSSLTTWVNVLSGIFEKELSVTFMLVTNENVIGNTQFNGLSLTQMADKSREVLQQNIGLANYDLGLVFGTGATSGLSYIGAVCENGGDGGFAYKGGGAVLFSTSCFGCDAGNPTGLGMLAHEVGHLFGATHTFNADNAQCSPTTRVPETAYESGGGLTLMSNAGNCAGNNIVTARALHFHSGSFEQMAAFINDNFGGCATVTNNSNNPPTVTVNGGTGHVIPKQTPFTLTATGSDADAGDVPNLTYVWEETDAGGAFPNPPYADQANDPPGTTRPLFRPFAPATSGASRTFPSWEYIRTKGNIPPATDANGLQIAENLPAVTRQLNFKVTVRDQRGGVANESVSLDVRGNAGPFRVTFPNGGETFLANSEVTVRWDVAYTGKGTPINCEYVKISLSTDGGQNFSTLIGSTPNIGSANVTLTGGTFTTGRIKVEAVGNVFFDISNVNFQTTPNTCTFSISPTGQTFSTSSGNGGISLSAGSGCPWTAVSNDDWISITSGTSGNGGGTINFSVPTNGGVTRRGTIRVGSQTFTVTQKGTASGEGLMFYALSQPVRLLETRPDFPGFPLQGCFRPDVPITGGTARTQLARGTCDIPSDAVAIMGNITVVSTIDYPAAGSLTLYASDIPKPNTENSNFNEGETTNNVFTVALGADGAFKIHPTATKHVVVDVTGYYAPPGNAGLFFHSLPQPIRLLETRNIPGFPLEGCYRPNAKLTGTYDGNSNPNLDQLQQGRVPYTCAMIMPAEVPTSAQLLIGNATTVNTTEGGGYLTIYPSDASRTFIASSNYAGNDVINGPFTVRMGPDGKFKIYTFATTDLVIDILGYFSTEAFDQNGAGLLFNPLSKPVRLLETRSTPSNLPGCYKTNAQIQDGFNNPADIRVQPAQGTCEGVTIPTQALAIVGNATVTNQMTGGGPGFLTFWPGNVENRPLAATSNFGAQSPNGYNRHFFVGLSPNGELNAGAFNLLSNVPTDLRVDVSGYFAP